MRTNGVIRQFIIVLSVLLGCAPAQTLQAAPFQVAFEQYLREDGIKGGSCALVNEGRVASLYTFGMADVALNQPVDSNTVYHWASITKTLTAVAVMQLRDRGSLSLDDPVMKYVPELSRIHSENNAVARVTIRELLSHTAGFQTPTWPYTDGKPWQPFEPTEWSQLVAMMPYQELSFEPGTRFQYSNPGFIYLARVIEAITGDPYQTYIQKNLLTPLGMTHSFYNVSPSNLAKYRSNSYASRIDNQGQEALQPFGREFNTGITTANGGLNAPVGDMAKWISFLAGSGSMPDADSILSRKSIEEMWRPIMTVPADEAFSGAKSVGLSFFQYFLGSESAAPTFIGHTGHQAGFAAFFLINPRNGKAAICNFNTVPAQGPAPRQQARYEDSQHRFSALMQQAMQVIQ